jgi:hypothetical protein
MARSTLGAWSIRGFGLAFVLGACNQVLGIEPASIDPRLSAAGHTSSSHGAAGAGGSSVSTAGAGGSGGSEVAAASGGTGAHEQVSNGGSSGKGAEAGAGATPTGSGGSATAGTHGDDSHVVGESGQGGEAGQKSAPADPCDEYCTAMDADCAGNDAQYRDRDQCMKICHLLPEGTPGGADDDSVECRLKYVQKMRYANGSELSGYCQEAGPSGDAKCGSVCEAYCALMAEVCTADVAGVYHFASDADCMQTCAALPPATVPYSTTNPLVSDGNHVLCRLFHVTSAAMADADEHCEHAMGVTLCEATSE